MNILGATEPSAPPPIDNQPEVKQSTNPPLPPPPPPPPPPPSPPPNAISASRPFSAPLTSAENSCVPTENKQSNTPPMVRFFLSKLCVMYFINTSTYAVMSKFDLFTAYLSVHIRHSSYKNIFILLFF